ncbi:zinc finger protein 267-like [Biomphalaria glabrata]|uniref:Zinc finger protein 267-like n=1 Tax=Biomphalaria glabrata TaxID=6526 RepID=A0A9W2YSN9_BIOGL|nr:zinc finger protein 267-like [Biomphalaria glabrata]XP_055865816.1 zinc finger protein 267-like [Biomphalaria glabrata]
MSECAVEDVKTVEDVLDQASTTRASADCIGNLAVFGGHPEMEISEDLTVSDSSLSSLVETSSHLQGLEHEKTCVSSFPSSEENNQEMQIVLAGEGVDLSEMASNNMIIHNAVPVQGEDMDTQIVYLNPDGTISFDPTGFLTTTTTDNASSISEPSDRYMLSTALQGNIILNSSNIQSSEITLGPHSQLAFKNEDMVNVSKFGSLSEYAQQTLTMVIDNSSSLGSDYILVEPSSLVVGQTPEGDSAKNSLGSYHSMKSALIDIPSMASCSIPVNATVDHKPTFELATYSVKLEELPIQCSAEGNVIGVNEQGVAQGAGDIISPDYGSLANMPRQGEILKDDGQSIQEKSLTEKHKSELRHLEQSHLEHHLKLTKRKQIESKCHSSDMVRTPDHSDCDSQDQELIEALEKNGINDKTPIFSSISAKVNASILNVVPGCQHFLLQQAHKFKDESTSIIFNSNSDCTFSGDINSFIKFHNEIKQILKMQQTTFLDTRLETSGKQLKEEKGIHCELLRPYISARGRKPKCSVKALQMGFVTSLENYLSNDGLWSLDEDNKSYSRGSRHLYSHRRKRGRPRKYLQNTEKKIKVTERNEVKQGCQEKDDPGSSNISKEGHLEEGKSETQKDSLQASESIQACISEEQSNTQNEGLKADKSVNDEEEHSEMNQSLENRIQESDVKEGQENPLPTEVMVTKRRGRPCKKYDTYLTVEKALPRNPLTESLATKQQRNYEEHLAFKFFCSQCSFKTKRQSHFHLHMKCHRDGTERKYSCGHCEFVSISLPMLKRHELKHKQNLFRCEICGVYTTDSQKLLHRHMRLKHSTDQTLEEKLACQQCTFTCLRPEEMAQHQAGHDRLSQATNSCSMCEKNFRSRMHLQRHIRDVHGPEIRPHLCDTCGKAFKRTDALQQHKLVHISKSARSLPYKCSICDKGFRSQAHLKEHSSMHSSERPYLCQYCGAAFKTQPVQRKHIMTLHLQPKNHVCSVCCRQFKTKYALHRHESSHKAETEPATAAAAILIIDSDNCKTEIDAEKNTLSSLDVYPVSLKGATISMDDQVSTCLVQDIRGSAATVIEAPLEQSAQCLEQAFIQAHSDGTLYYFTGELPTL